MHAFDPETEEPPKPREMRMREQQLDNLRISIPTLGEAHATILHLRDEISRLVDEQRRLDAAQKRTDRVEDKLLGIAAALAEALNRDA